MQSEARITQQELATIFPDGVPMPVMKMIFPEKSEKMTVGDIRFILNAMRPEAALSTDAEPVAWIKRSAHKEYGPYPAEFTEDAALAEMWRSHPNTFEVVPLYAAPPAPAVAVKALQFYAEYFEKDTLGDFAREALSALSAQVQDVAGLESNPETLRWWCQQLLDIIENYNISQDVCEEEIALLNDIRAAVDPAAKDGEQA